MEKKMILIEIRGGNVESVSTNIQDLHFQIIDHDNLKDGDASSLLNLYEPDVVTNEKEIKERVDEVMKEYIF